MKRKVIIGVPIFFVLVILATLYQVNTQNKKMGISEEGIVFGNDSADNVMIIFTSFTCEKCKILSKNIHSYISEEIGKGKLRVIYKSTDKKFYCVPNESFYSFDKLSEYYLNTDLYYDDITKVTVLSSAEVEKRQKMYDTIQKEVDNDDISVLPTFFINGNKYVGDYSEEQFKKLLN